MLKLLTYLYKLIILNHFFLSKIKNQYKEKNIFNFRNKNNYKENKKYNKNA